MSLDECPACGALPNDWRDSPQVNIAALAARLRATEERLADMTAERDALRLSVAAREADLERERERVSDWAGRAGWNAGGEELLRARVALLEGLLKEARLWLTDERLKRQIRAAIWGREAVRPCNLWTSEVYPHRTVCGTHGCSTDNHNAAPDGCALATKEGG